MLRHPGGLWSWEPVNSVGRGSTARSDGHSCLAGSLFSRDKCRRREAFRAEPMGLGPTSDSLCLLKKKWHPACHGELPLGAGSLPAGASPIRHLAVQGTHGLFHLQPGATECQGAGSRAISLIPFLRPLCRRGGCEGAEWVFDRAEAAVAF